MLLMVGLELVGFVVLCAIAVTQVLVPLFRGTALFPAFRHYEVDKAVVSAAEEVEQLEDALRAAKLRHHADDLRDELKRTSGR